VTFGHSSYCDIPFAIDQKLDELAFGFYLERDIQREFNKLMVCDLSRKDPIAVKLGVGQMVQLREGLVIDFNGCVSYEVKLKDSQYYFSELASLDDMPLNLSMAKSKSISEASDFDNEGIAHWN